MKIYKNLKIILTVILIFMVFLIVYCFDTKTKIITNTNTNSNNKISRFNPEPIVGNWFFLQGADPLEKPEMQIVKDAGISGIRYEFNWQTIETKTIGNYNWVISDAAVKSIKKNKLKCIGLIDYGNGLYNDPGKGNYCRSFDMSTEKEMDGYITFVKKILERYKGNQIIWEIQNEPDLYLYDNDISCGEKPFKNNLSDKEKGKLYAKLLQKVAKQIRPSFPNEIIITGGLAAAGSEMVNAYIDKVCIDKSLNAFDGFGFHEYQLNIEKYNFESKSVDKTWKLNTLKNRLSNNDYKNIVFVNTETGGSGGDIFETKLNEFAYDNVWDGFDSDGSLSDLQQAAFIPRTYLFGLSNSSSVYVYHRLDDLKRNTEGDVDKPRERFFGIIDTLGHKKPSFYALKTMLTQLNGYKLIENKSQPNIIDQENYRMLNAHLVFTKNNNFIHVIWGVQDATNTYKNTRLAKFNLPIGKYTKTNMLGTKSEIIEITKIPTEIEVNEYPTYIKKND